MKIQLTNFSKRHFSNDFNGTKIKDLDILTFQKEINEHANLLCKKSKLIDGYAPFCKLLIVPNFTDTKTGTLPIELNNLQYLRSGYSSRTPDELPVLSRWFEIPNDFIPKANYLVIILYSRTQCEIEWLETRSSDKFELDLDTDFGVVAILAQMTDDEEPMSPITMMRNSLGISEGGSGFPLNRDKYLESVNFWKKNAMVK